MTEEELLALLTRAIEGMELQLRDQFKSTIQSAAEHSPGVFSAGPRALKDIWTSGFQAGVAVGMRAARNIVLDELSGAEGGE